MFFHIIKTWNSENKSGYKKINEIVYAFLTLAFGIYYPFYIIRLGANYPGVFFTTAVEEMTFLGNLFLFGGTLCVIGWATSGKIRTLKHPELLKDQNNYKVFCERFLREYPQKNHLKRKVTHILPVFVVCLCIIVGYLFRPLLGSAWSKYACFFIIIIGIDFGFTFIMGDLIRLLDYGWMPPSAAKMFESSLTPNELNSFSSTSVMVFSFCPFMFFSFPIFFIELLITAIADAMASIVGMSINDDKKHKFPKGSDKSIEGYITGFGFTFACTMFGVFFSNSFGLSKWSLELTLTLAIVLSITFVLIDIVTSKIELQDNYLNPLITGGITILFLLTLKVSIF